MKIFSKFLWPLVNFFVKFILKTSDYFLIKFELPQKFEKSVFKKMFENFDCLIVKILNCDEILIKICENSSKKKKCFRNFG